MERQPSRGLDNRKEQARQKREKEARRLNESKEKREPLFGPPVLVRRANDPVHDKVQTILGNYDSVKQYVSSHNMIGAVLQPETPLASSSSSNPFSSLPNKSSSTTKQSGTGDGASQSDAGPPNGVKHEVVSRQGVFERFNHVDVKTSLSPVETEKLSSSRTNTTSTKSSTATKSRQHSSRKDALRTESRHGSGGTSDSRAVHASKVARLSAERASRQAVGSSETAAEAEQTSRHLSNSDKSNVNGCCEKPVELNSSSETVAKRRSVGGKLSDELRPALTNGTAPHPNHRKPNNPSSRSAELKLAIPSPTERVHEFEDFISDVLKEVSVPSPLTAILTPKKTDTSNTFPFHSSPVKEFPDKRPLLGRHHHGRESSNEGSADHCHNHRPSNANNQVVGGARSPPKLLSSLSSDLVVSSSEAESDADDHDDGDLSSKIHKRDDHLPEQQMVTSVVPVTSCTVSTSNRTSRQGGGMVNCEKKRHASSYSDSSESEEVESSDSEDDSESNSSDDEDIKDVVVTDDADKTECPAHISDKQSKRPSWEMKNFVPKEKPQVPFLAESDPVVSSLAVNSRADIDDLKSLCNDLLDFEDQASTLSPLNVNHDSIVGMSHNIDDVVDSVINLDVFSPLTALADAKQNPAETELQSLPSGLTFTNGRPSILVKLRRLPFHRYHTSSPVDAKTEASAVLSCADVCESIKVEMPSPVPACAASPVCVKPSLLAQCEVEQKALKTMAEKSPMPKASTPSDSAKRSSPGDRTVTNERERAGENTRCNRQGSKRKSQASDTATAAKRLCPTNRSRQSADSNETDDGRIAAVSTKSKLESPKKKKVPTATLR